MRRIVATLAVAACVVSGVVTASADAPPQPTPLLPAGAHAAYYDSLTALAGSANYLAYSRSNRAPDGNADASTSTLWIRKADGTTYQLSPTMRDPQANGVWSVGPILVVRGGYLGQPDVWYNLATGTHGTPTPAPASTNGVVAGASKDGWLTVSQHQPGGDEVFDTTTSGTVTSDGVPFPGTNNDPQLLPGPNGVIAAAYPSVAYMKYSNPGSWTTLTAISQGNVACTDLSATDVSCVKYVDRNDGGDDFTPIPTSILQVPLDGSAVVKTTPECAGSQPRLSAAAVVWLCRTHVYSVPLGGGPVSESSITVPLDTPLASAQGTVDLALSPTDGPATMYAVTVADQAFEPLFVTSHSSVEASQLAVTSGRVAWQDDRDPRLPVSVLSVTRSANGGLDLGMESHAFDEASLSDLAVSGARTVVNTTGSGALETSPVGTHRVPTSGLSSVAFVNEQPLSGNRYLFVRSHRTFYDYMVRDLRSRQDRIITSPDKTPIVAAALWGDEIAFVDRRDGVWSQNLATGKLRRLKAPLPQPGNVAALVSVYNHEVGWDILRRHHGLGRVHAHYRNIHTMAPATRLSAHDVITQASSDGLVIQHFPDPSRINLFGGGSTTATWELQPYGGGARQVLADYPIATQLTVDNGVGVYLDANQQPAAFAIAHPSAAAPVSLGDPIAPKRFVDTKQNRWTTYQAFSRPLTSCAIVIRRSGSLVARLHCDLTAMRTGDAYAQWDGRDTSGKRVHAGTYRWRIRAGNAKGSVRNPGNRALHGVLTISR